MNSEALNKLSFSKLKSVKPKAVKLSQEALVTTDYFETDKKFPLIIQPAVEDVNLVAWAASKREFIEAQLLKHGAILFRNFKGNSITEFERFTRAISTVIMEYGERSSPRTQVRGKVYTSTDHPADQYILLHNEQSYTLNWPMKIWFLCVQPAQQGGRTPIASSRNIYKHLAPSILETFRRKQVMYVRNYSEGLGLPWQEVFQTNDRAVVEEYCRRACIEFLWKDQNHLRTCQVRPAIQRHPKTGELLWFNHVVFFHVSSLESSVRKSLLAVVKEEALPYNTFYGDGSPIEPSVLDEIREIYRQETVTFLWHAGEILMLDNMLTAHGREPFVGSREILVAMAEPFSGYEGEDGL